MRRQFFTVSTLYLFLVLFSGCGQQKMHPTDTAASANTHNKIQVPIGGNAWARDGGQIEEAGLVNWSDTRTVCTVYLRLEQAGSLHIALQLDPQNSNSRIQVTALGKSAEVTASGAGKQSFDAGEWQVSRAGYVAVEIRGLTRSGADFGVLSAVAASGTAVTRDAAYVQNNDDHYFYWGRRGPSVHLNYNTDGLGDIEWFYSEITVPAGNDVMGSYFMADGFGEGYFGMQVNSETERRVLFSVWSPYQTDDPSSIPADQRIAMLKKGEGVHTGEFGNEGAGGQSYLVFPWKAGNTYRFLLRGRPGADNSTTYTAWFFAPEENAWRLIASFKRPQTQTWLKHLHGFLENFIPETGNTTRMAFYGNQWVCNRHGTWNELTKMRFTGDNTARKNFRKDYSGGAEGNRFFLRNCGFFDDFTELDREFTRAKGTQPPVINFIALP